MKRSNHTTITLGAVLAVAALVLGWASTAAAGPAEDCEAAKLKASGDKAACLLKAEADAVKKGQEPNTGQCVSNFNAAFGAAEGKYENACPTVGDVDDIESLVDACRDEVAAALSGSPPSTCPQFPATGQTMTYQAGDDGQIQAGATLSYTVNGNIVHDNNINLDWEMKTAENVGDVYTWSNAFVYIASLNTEPCFAGHCDWRLPNIKELQSIVDYGRVAPSIHPSFGPTVASNYWSSTTFATDPGVAWFVNFGSGNVGITGKLLDLRVRAVRGGS